MRMAKSTYYFEISKTDVVAIRNQDLMVEIREIFEKNKGRYGVRRVHRELLNRGYKVNHKRVQRLMHTMELKGKRPKEKYHSYQGEKGKIAENIIDRDFSTTGPLQKWTTDVSTPMRSSRTIYLFRRTLSRLRGCSMMHSKNSLMWTV